MLTQKQNIIESILRKTGFTSRASPQKNYMSKDELLHLNAWIDSVLFLVPPATLATSSVIPSITTSTTLTVSPAVKETEPDRVRCEQTQGICPARGTDCQGNTTTS